MAQAPLQTTGKLDNSSGTTTDRQRNWSATDGAILNQDLFRLRSIDLDRKHFAAVRADDFGLRDKVHLVAIPATLTARSARFTGNLILSRKEILRQQPRSIS